MIYLWSSCLPHSLPIMGDSPKDKYLFVGKDVGDVPPSPGDRTEGLGLPYHRVLAVSGAPLRFEGFLDLFGGTLHRPLDNGPRHFVGDRIALGVLLFSCTTSCTT